MSRQANAESAVAIAPACAAPDLPAQLEELRRELQLRDRALDLAARGCFAIDMRNPAQPIVFVNTPLARHTQHTVEDLLGQSAVLENYGELRQSCDVRIGPDVLLNDVLLNSLSDSNGTITHYLCVIDDKFSQVIANNSRKELQERLFAELREHERMAVELRIAQKLEAVGRLAAGVAHEINTPIQYVGDSVHFLQSALGDFQKVLDAYRDGINRLVAGAAPQQVKDELDAAERAGDIEFHTVEMPKAFARTMDGVARVAQIVRAMKEFAHPSVDEQSPADINHALQTTLIVAKNEYKYVAQVETEFGELPHVMCNIGELNQVFLNLIVNAAHAIAESGKDATQGKISITTRLAEENIEVVIADNGRGIAKENMPKIFDPFFTTKEVGKGTGQGLAITRAIVIDKHRGSVNVKSKVGAGSRFIVRLPIAGRPSTGIEAVS